MIRDENHLDSIDGFEGDKEEFRALYHDMQTPEHREACRNLFEASVDELNASYRPTKIVATTAHMRAGLKWLFGRFSLAIDLTDDEAARLLNSSSDDLADLRNENPTDKVLISRSDLAERLSLLLGIYGAIARIAPDGASRFVYVAFRQAQDPAYGERTLIEYLLFAESLESWYAVRGHLRSLEAGFLG